MELNITIVITALNSMNFTTNCSASIDWLSSQGSLGLTSMDADSTVNLAFLRGILSSDFATLGDETLSNLYSQLSLAKPAIWQDSAVESIQAGCLAPQLAKSLSFGELDLTFNCSATATYYGNTLCAVNGPQNGVQGAGNWTVDTLGNSAWILGGPPTAPLDSSNGLAMLREALPMQYKNLSDVELASWSSLVVEHANSFTNKSQIMHLCDVCLKEFCAAAQFTGNPDIGGIGALVSYVTGAALVTMSLIYWVIKTITDWRRERGANDDVIRGPFRLAARYTLGALGGGALALALSLGLALLVFLIRNAKSAVNSDYEQIMAENATYISFYVLLVLGTYFPLSKFTGPDFATIWTCLYYVVVLLQLITILAVAFDALVRYGTLRFGDEACLRMQLGNSSWDNPFVYSILFFVVVGVSRILLVLAFAFKSLEKLFQMVVSRMYMPKESKDTRPTKLRRMALRIREVLSDTEALSLLVASPLCITGLIFVSTWLLARFAFRFFQELPWAEGDFKRLRVEYYQNLPDTMNKCFEIISYGAWVLSFLSVPLMWINMAFLLRVRYAMSLIAGPAWIENQVGFGQVLALFIWIPVMIGFSLSLCKIQLDQGLPRWARLMT